MSGKAIINAIVQNDLPVIRKLLKKNPLLANDRLKDTQFFRSIYHYIYRGDTLLHLAAASYREAAIGLLIKSGADIHASSGMRRATPLHYASDGYINSRLWSAKAQVKAIEQLIHAGSDINAQDANGATPLHRAVRTRSAAAVELLLQAGCDPMIRNKPGSTAFHLAVQDTGKSGSGSPAARGAQKQIIEIFLNHRISPRTRNSRGKTVRDCARSDWIRDLLT